MCEARWEITVGPDIGLGKRRAARLWTGGLPHTVAAQAEGCTCFRFTLMRQGRFRGCCRVSRRRCSGGSGASHGIAPVLSISGPARRFIEARPVRSIPLRSGDQIRKRVLVYTDATGRGTMAYVIKGPGCQVFASAEAPAGLRSWLQPRETQVGPFELVAAIAGVERAMESFPDCEIILFIDNQSALGVVGNGSSPVPDMCALVQGLWFACAAKGVFLVTFWVPSELNLADWPTRPDEKAPLLEKLRARFSQEPFRWPTNSPWRAA
jgi:hypothetical protein